MGRMLYDCTKCTNKMISAVSGSEYCAAMVRGERPLKIIGSGIKDYISTCSGFTTEPKNQELYTLDLIGQGNERFKTNRAKCPHVVKCTTFPIGCGGQTYWCGRYGKTKGNVYGVD